MTDYNELKKLAEAQARIVELELVMQSIADSLKMAGAKLPIDNKGTIESAIQTGLSIALCIVEDAIAKSASKEA